ncbi:hypothetical protein ACOSQ4_022571 [Xanthoceras sorbifolium]
MRYISLNDFLVIFGMVYCISCKETNAEGFWNGAARFLVPDVTIDIQNNMPSNAYSLYLHCKSEKVDRLGEHWLANGKRYSWTFDVDVRGTTLYNCYMQWGGKRKWFTVYKGEMGTDDQYYSVRVDGLYKSKFGPKGPPKFYKKEAQW